LVSIDRRTKGMRATRIVQRNALKKKVKFYQQALLGAKHLIDSQAEQLRKHDPGSLIGEVEVTGAVTFQDSKEPI
jgi:predicted peroxiredoxin